MLICDTTCPDTLAPYLSIAVREAGVVATDAEYQKSSHLDSTHCFEHLSWSL